MRQQFSIPAWALGLRVEKPSNGRAEYRAIRYPVLVKNWPTKSSVIDSVHDESGRLIAPPQSIYPERPVGPWTTNTDQRGA